MRGHSRSKNGVLSHAYDPRIHGEVQRTRALRPCTLSGLMDCRVNLGNDQLRGSSKPLKSLQKLSGRAAAGWEFGGSARPGECAFMFEQVIAVGREMPMTRSSRRTDES